MYTEKDYKKFALALQKMCEEHKQGCEGCQFYNPSSEDEECSINEEPHLWDIEMNFREEIQKRIDALEELKEQGLYTDVDHAAQEAYEEALKIYEGVA